MDIPFQVISQTALEQTPPDLSLQDMVTYIARQKMDHVIISSEYTQSIAYVLTADTLGKDSRGAIHGKPESKEDAIAKIKALRGSGYVGTAFCLDKKKLVGSVWHTEQRIEKYVDAQYVFDMPDAWIERYLTHTPNYMNISGGITVEGYGAQFLKSIKGSYTTILGLPVFEVREALEQIGFGV
jgi:septum formation protein